MFIPRLPAIAFMIAGPAMFLSATLLSGATIPPAANAADASATSVPVQIAQASDTRRNLVQRVQELLIRLGYDTGPADGVIGDRTTRSVQMFQKQKGLTADGNVSEALYLVLVASIETAAQKAEKNAESPNPAISNTGSIAPPLAAAAPSVVINFTNSRWSMVDSTGARATLVLLSEGKVGGVESPGFWRWQLRDGGLRIMYDNKVGGQVTRRGRIVSENEIRGDANSSRGMKWTWVATRIQ